jgi:hypothetical protein
MNCFYHQTTPAIGVCKSCGKGVCPACAVDLGKGLACFKRCEENAHALIQYIDHSIERAPYYDKLTKSARSSRFSGAIFLVIFGLIMVSVGGYGSLTTGGDASELVPLGLGALFLIYGLVSLWRARNFRSLRLELDKCTQEQASNPHLTPASPRGTFWP